jgi:DNA-binding MarR family transcriptional regulator
MPETAACEQDQPLLGKQVEQLTTIFLDLRRVLGVGFKHAHQNGFSMTQFIVLGLIGNAQTNGDTCTISSIATHLGLDPATVVRTVDSLEKRGLVERRRSREDRRQVFVEFTAAGRSARQHAHEQFIERIHAIFLGMSADGRAALIRGLEEFVRVGLQPHSEEGPEKHD